MNKNDIDQRIKDRRRFMDYLAELAGAKMWFFYDNVYHFHFPKKHGK